MEEVDLPPRKYVFGKEIKLLMYGFGDEAAVQDETAELMEEFLEEYVGNLTQRAMAHATRPKSSDFLLALQGDRKKSFRANQLLKMDKEIRDARQVGDEAIPEVIAANMKKDS